MRPRAIPCLLLQRGSLVKTVRFGNPRYVGDPVNVVQLFNDLGADEVVLLDIGAPRDRAPPDFGLIAQVAAEAFMPLAYGGGIRSPEDAEKVFRAGVEKVVLNTAAMADPGLVTALARRYGSQAVVVSIDVKRGLLGRASAWAAAGTAPLKSSPEELARSMEAAGAGEILLNSIDRDGTYQGYDLELVRRVSSAVGIPVIACGGASDLRDLASAVREGGASAAAAGSLFVFQGKDLGVLINFPTEGELEETFG